MQEQNQLINVNKYLLNKINILFLGPKIPINQFLNRLPKTVIKNGQVIDIRQNVEQHLNVSNNQTSKNSIGFLKGKQETTARCDRYSICYSLKSFIFLS